MNLEDLLRSFWARPQLQRLFLAFTVGLMLSCAARVAGTTPSTSAPAGVFDR